MDDLDRLKSWRDELHRRVQEALRLENALVNDAFTPENICSAYERWQEQKGETVNAVTLWHAASDAYLNALKRSTDEG